MVKDPICGMNIDETKANYSTYYRQCPTCPGRDYYFCSIGCKNTFDKDPEKYAHSA